MTKAKKAEHKPERTDKWHWGCPDCGSADIVVQGKALMRWAGNVEWDEHGRQQSYTSSDRNWTMYDMPEDLDMVCDDCGATFDKATRIYETEQSAQVTCKITFTTHQAKKCHQSHGYMMDDVAQRVQELTMDVEDNWLTTDSFTRIANGLSDALFGLMKSGVSR